MPNLMRIVVMGVCGCGKTTLARAVADHYGLEFVEGDELHPAENVAAMAAGIPLNDAMRAPWLALIADRMKHASGNGIVVSCSALKKSYRDILRTAGSVHFLHLTLDKDTAYTRVGNRKGHYMPTSLVDSQFTTLEALASDEQGIALDATQPIAELETAVRNYLG